MGGCDFTVRAKGKSAEEAFRSAVDVARYENGHGGYSGTIAEKDSFIEFPMPAGDVYEFIENMLGGAHEESYKIDDKWGPCGCVKIDEETYIFFGWASS